MIKTDEDFQPYLKEWNKKEVRFPLAIKDNTDESYENISYSYEIFNEVIIWGMVNYPKLKDFFVHDTEIHGTKVSFDRDVFKKLSPKEGIQFKLLKDIQKKDSLYRRLSKSQKQITNLINDYDKSQKKIKDKYLQICRGKIKNKYGEYDYDYKIITYPEHVDLSEHKKNKLLNENKYPLGKNKGRLIKDLDKDFIQWLIQSKLYKTEKKLREKVLEFHKDLIIELEKKVKKGGKRNKRRTMKKKKKTIQRKRIQKNKHTLHYFSADWCGYCKEFNKTWDQLKDVKKMVDLKKTVINDNNEHLLSHYNIVSFPTLLLIKENGERIYYSSDSRTKEEIQKFIQDNL